MCFSDGQASLQAIPHCRNWRLRKDPAMLFGFDVLQTEPWSSHCTPPRVLAKICVRPQKLPLICTLSIGNNLEPGMTPTAVAGNLEVVADFASGLPVHRITAIVSPEFLSAVLRPKSHSSNQQNLRKTGLTGRPTRYFSTPSSNAFR